MADRPSPEIGPAFYSSGSSRLAGAKNLLHLPYTLWHLSYVVVGAAIGDGDLPLLAIYIGCFFLGVGIAAHCFDEISGRPLRTPFSDASLWAVGLVSLVFAAGLAVATLIWIDVTPLVLPLIAFGVFIVLAYNLEWFGGRLHTDAWFAFSWGAFPLIVSAVVQNAPLAGTVLLAGWAFLSSRAQRHLSLRARFLRRKVSTAGTRLLLKADGPGKVVSEDLTDLLGHVEGPLQWMWKAQLALALGLLIGMW